MRALMTYTNADTEITVTVAVTGDVFDAAEQADVDVWHYGIKVHDGETGAVLATMPGNSESELRWGGPIMTPDLDTCEIFPCDGDGGKCVECAEVDTERAYLEADGS